MSFTMRLFRAYFADGLNIGLISTLAELGASVGLARRNDAGSTRKKAVQRSG